MKKNIFFIITFILLSGLALLFLLDKPHFECTDSIGCVSIAPGAPVKIAAIQSLTGKTAFLGMEQIRGIELAVAARGGLFLGHPVKLQKENALCSSEGGTIAALKIAADPEIIAVIGTTCSGSAIPASKIISEAGMLMISGNNSSPVLTSSKGVRGSGWNPGYFRTSFNDDLSGYSAGVFAFHKLGITRAALINDGDVYTKGLTDGFHNAFEKNGGKIVLDTGVNKGDINMLPVLKAVADSGAELLFMPLFQPEGDFIVKQAGEIRGLENVIIMGNGALLTETFIESVKQYAAGMYFVGPAPVMGPAYERLKAEYEARYKESPPTTYYSYAFDAVNLLFNAIEASAVKEKNGTLHIGREALRKALYSTTGLEGVSGIINCDSFGDCGAARFNIVRLDDPDAGIEGLKTNIIYTFTPR